MPSGITSSKRFFGLLLAMFGGLAAAPVAQADSMMAQLSSDSARFRYTTTGLGQSFGNLETSFGFLYTDNSGEKNSYLADVGSFVRGESVEAPIIVSIGGRLYAGKAKDYTVYAVGLGGDALLLPDSWGGFGLGAFFIIAPGVVSFGDSDGLMEYGATMHFEVSPQASVLLGYQKIETDIKNAPVDKVTIDDGVFFAVHVTF